MVALQNGKHILIGLCLFLLLVLAWLLPNLKGLSMKSALPKIFPSQNTTSDEGDTGLMGLFGTAPKSSIESLILYAYYETENAFENARFFLQHGLHNSSDFIFIINGPSSLLLDLIPKQPNIRVIQRENTCMDMGSYGEVLTNEPKLRTKYKKFIMLNASIRGPFIPIWSDACWSEAYSRTINDVVKIQGMTSNCMFDVYEVQSMIFATDHQGLEALLDNGTLNCSTTHRAAIDEEIHMAHKLYSEHGWESNSFMTASRGHTIYSIDERHHCHEQPDGYDHLYDNGYFGFNIHPYETIFTKANRGINPKALEKLTQWHDDMGYSSYDYC